MIQNVTIINFQVFMPSIPSVLTKIEYKGAWVIGVLGALGTGLGIGYFLGRKNKSEKQCSINGMSDKKVKKYVVHVNNGTTDQKVRNSQQQSKTNNVEAESLLLKDKTYRIPDLKIEQETRTNEEPSEYNNAKAECLILTKNINATITPVTELEKKQRRRVVKYESRGGAIYNPLLLPDLIKEFGSEQRKEAFEKLYSLCNNELFQCSKEEFCYWFGGSSDGKADPKTCRRISFKKSVLALQYFIKQIYHRTPKFSKGKWEEVANVFKLDGRSIPIGRLGKNTGKVGTKDKELIDGIIKELKKEVKRNYLVA